MILLSYTCCCDKVGMLLHDLMNLALLGDRGDRVATRGRDPCTDTGDVGELSDFIDDSFKFASIASSRMARTGLPVNICQSFLVQAEFTRLRLIDAVEEGRQSETMADSIELPITDCIVGIFSDSADRDGEFPDSPISKALFFSILSKFHGPFPFEDMLIAFLGEVG